jgi:hypothetical protein
MIKSCKRFFVRNSFPHIPITFPQALLAQQIHEDKWLTHPNVVSIGVCKEKEDHYLSVGMKDLPCSSLDPLFFPSLVLANSEWVRVLYHTSDLPKAQSIPQSAII